MMTNSLSTAYRIDMPVVPPFYYEHVRFKPGFQGDYLARFDWPESAIIIYVHS